MPLAQATISAGNGTKEWTTISAIEPSTPQEPHERINATVPSTVSSRRGTELGGNSKEATVTPRSSTNTVAATLGLIHLRCAIARFFTTSSSYLGIGKAWDMGRAA